VAAAATHMMVAPSLLSLLHETWGLEGVREGECQEGCFHLLTFLPDHQQMPWHISPKLVPGRVWGRGMPDVLCATPALLWERRWSGYGLLLSRDWTGAPGPWPLPRPDRDVWALPSLSGESKDRRPHGGQVGSWGLPLETA
jgi:hypothetical protein